MAEPSIQALRLQAKAKGTYLFIRRRWRHYAALLCL